MGSLSQTSFFYWLCHNKELKIAKIPHRSARAFPSACHPESRQPEIPPSIARRCYAVRLRYASLRMTRADEVEILRSKIAAGGISDGKVRLRYATLRMTRVGTIETPLANYPLLFVTEPSFFTRLSSCLPSLPSRAYAIFH